MSGEMKRMLTSKNFLAAWLIACAALLFGQTYPSLKKPLTCGAFIDLLDSAIKGQIVSFILPIAAVLTWSDSFLQEYRSGFLKTALPRTSRSQYVEGKVFSILMSGFLVWLLAVITVLLVNFVIFYPMEVKGNIPKDLLTKLLMKALSYDTSKDAHAHPWRYHKYPWRYLRNSVSICLYGLRNSFYKLLFRNYFTPTIF